MLQLEGENLYWQDKVLFLPIIPTSFCISSYHCRVRKWRPQCVCELVSVKSIRWIAPRQVSNSIQQSMPLDLKILFTNEANFFTIIYHSQLIQTNIHVAFRCVQILIYKMLFVIYIRDINFSMNCTYITKKMWSRRGVTLKL